MIFAPVARRTVTYTAHPLAADLALQKFLLSALAQARSRAPASAPTAPPAQAANTETTASTAASARPEVTPHAQATTLQLDVPGLTREQLVLTVEGPRVSLHSVEGAPRTVRRTWQLPHDIDLATSKARLEHGVLTLTLARLEPVSQATTLTIQ